MTDPFAAVREFHERLGVPAPTVPALPGADRIALRVRLIREEQAEFEAAAAGGDVPGAADALADLVYVAVGAAIEFGVDLEPVFAAVHAANLQKVGGGRRADGKVQKPEGWRHPDIAGILRAQGWAEAQPPTP